MGQYWRVYVESYEDSDNYFVFETKGLMKLGESWSYSYHTAGLLKAIYDKFGDNPVRLALVGDYAETGDSEFQIRAIERTWTEEKKLIPVKKCECVGDYVLEICDEYGECDQFFPEGIIFPLLFAPYFHGASGGGDIFYDLECRGVLAGWPINVVKKEA